MRLKDERLVRPTGTSWFSHAKRALSELDNELSLSKDYEQFVQNYNMHNIGKTICELRVMLKLAEKGIPKKAATHAVLAIRGEVGHWRKNCLVYLDELNKKKTNTILSNTSSIFTIELYFFPNKSWVYDIDCGTYVCNTMHGLRGSRKLKQGALNLFVGDGMRATVELI
ncbi:hypothetical protein Tco_0024727 [Tanacetum coccineum]